MGHQINNVQRLFQKVAYRTKTTPELRDAMTRKVGALRTKIEERERRVVRVREEYAIDAERLAMLLMRFREEGGSMISYERQGSDAPTVPAGVIANLVREREMIDSEHDQVRKIELVLRNLRDEELYLEPRTGDVKSRRALHELTDDELEYLGF